MRQSPVSKKVPVYAIGWMNNMLKEKNKCFVRFEDFQKLEKLYQRLLQRYVKER